MTSTRVRRTAEASRAAIRDEAIRAFLRKGYQSTSLEEIGSGLGMTRAAVLYHYKTKEALLLAATEPALSAISRTLDGLPVVPRTSRAQRETAIGALLGDFIEHRDATALITRFTTDATVCDIGATVRRLNERAALAISGTLVYNDPALLARTVACLNAMVGVTASRIPLRLDDPTVRDDLSAGLLSLVGD